MELKLSVKKCVEGEFTDCQMQEIASRLCIKLPDKMRLVYYGQTAPLDTTLTWQPTDGADAPVGKVKTFEDGAWQ